MLVTVNVECTPQEARAFLGLPNVEPINDAMVQNVVSALETNRDLMDPTEVVKQWMAFGGAMRDQFFNVMTAAATSAADASGDAPPPRSAKSRSKA
ncbi:MAG: DUF6489 family protein [Caulobacterales bacterium]|nr:DUF6489 family protein [Caulobacterales bacterium]